MRELACVLVLLLLLGALRWGLAPRLRSPSAPIACAAATEGAPRAPTPHPPPPSGQGRRAPLFAFGGPTGPTGPGRPADASLYLHQGEYACVHLATTGFTPARGRIVELAVVRCDAGGAVLDTWASLLDPGPGELAGAAIHGLGAGAVRGAPPFGHLAEELLRRLQGRVVVAHNAELVGSFLGAELLRAGLLPARMPALNLLRLAPPALRAPNARLATLAKLTGGARCVPSGALDDALLVAAVLAELLHRYGARLAYPLPPPAARPSGGRPTPPEDLPGTTRPRGSVGVAPSGWLADLMTALPMSAAEGHDASLAAYVDAVTAVLPSGRIVTTEVQELTTLAVRAGHPAAQLRSVAERLLESLREAAAAEGDLRAEHVRHLRAAALSLGVPAYFDDLVTPPTPPPPPPGSGTFSRPVRKPPPTAPPVVAARCGHCLQVGHYTAACPRGRSNGGGGPAGSPYCPGWGPVEPIQPI